MAFRGIYHLFFLKDVKYSGNVSFMTTDTSSCYMALHVAYLICPNLFPYRELYDLCQEIR